MILEVCCPEYSQTTRFLKARERSNRAIQNPQYTDRLILKLLQEIVKEMSSYLRVD